MLTGLKVTQMVGSVPSGKPFPAFEPDTDYDYTTPGVFDVSSQNYLPGSSLRTQLCDANGHCAAKPLSATIPKCCDPITSCTTFCSGTISDGCGGTVQCGCAEGAVCSAGRCVVQNPTCKIHVCPKGFALDLAACECEQID
jgi:hypothetical protein